ncbi:MAG: hypothetical protein DMG43_12585 [Acidobacteria bacterium]|nr:MAG: hypothetical protein DMG43_12585 [Acidobacteriota bacterium]
MSSVFAVPPGETSQTASKISCVALEKQPLVFGKVCGRRQGLADEDGFHPQAKAVPARQSGFK